jgi:hypothetical protein
MIPPAAGNAAQVAARKFAMGELFSNLIADGEKAAARPLKLPYK